jgi:hypothetical protein
MAGEQDLRKWMLNEYKKCAQDPIYFMRKYVKIQNPNEGGTVPFDLYPFQEDTFKQFQQYRFNIILKSRQMGISTLVAGYALYCMLFKESFKVLVIAVTQDVAKNLVHKVKVMHESLPGFLKGKIVDDNKLELSFTNGSSIKAVSSSPSAARSHGLSLLIIDEMAHLDRSEEVWAGARATLAMGGSGIFLSSPLGVGNQFYKLYTQATVGKSDDGLELFNPIKLPWDLHPDRDAKFRETELNAMGPRLFAQEYECEFLTSGHTVIEGEILKWLDEYTTEPLERRGMSSDYWLWAYPRSSRDYVVFADVGRGDGNDNSSFQVLDVETLEQVAEYDGQMGTREFGNFLCMVGMEWNNALLCINNRNIGWDVVQQAIERNYSNLYYSFRNDPYLDPNIHIRKNLDLRGKEDKVPGFTETNPIRSVSISKLIEYLGEKYRNRDTTSYCKINSKRLINQLYVFVWLNGKAQGAPGYHDDLVISYMYQLYMHDIALKMRIMGIDMTKKALTHTYKTVYKPMQRRPVEWQMQTASGVEDITWVIKGR